MINLKHFVQRKKRRKTTEEKGGEGRGEGGEVESDRGEELKGIISEKMEGEGGVVVVRECW